MNDVPAATGRYGRLRPRPGLTPVSVATAGRRVIERDGLDALTMRAVAAELSTAPASLYRHVADREALLLAILEQVAEGLPVEVPGADPHERLVGRFLAAHDYMRDHVWVLHVLITGEHVAEAAFPFSEACLADFASGGLPAGRALGAFRVCWQLVIGELLDRHPVRAPRAFNQRQRAVAALRPDRFPVMTRAMAEQHDEGEQHALFALALSGLVASLLARTP
ncbi:helix-turn-helix domain-containing protein [Actinocorallia longicatena]|uniref:HTH tetR-type domain-containing protein n=1 Tax=Actinocorallia longicatena TaxID=111803 RepID=A0ABP6QAI1_9ACTN